MRKGCKRKSKKEECIVIGGLGTGMVRMFVKPGAILGVTMINLSECVKEGQVFLYGEELVGMQYILKKIWEGQELPEIRLVKNDENFNDAVSDVLHKMYSDVQDGVEREEYVLTGLNTIPVAVDVLRGDIRQVDAHMFEFNKPSDKE